MNIFTIFHFIGSERFIEEAHSFEHFIESCDKMILHLLDDFLTWVLSLQVYRNGDVFVYLDFQLAPWVQKYRNLIVPSYDTSPPLIPSDASDIVQRIESAKKNDSEISQLNKELKKVESGNLLFFEEKVQKEYSKLLGF